MPIDVPTLLMKVIDRTAEKLGELPALSAASALGDDALAEILSTQLLKLLDLGDDRFAGAMRSFGAEESLMLPSSTERRSHTEQLVASALGACTCWGDDDECEVCGGEGRPGWALPERSQFRRFVRPALRAIGEYRSAKESEGGVQAIRQNGSEI